ncbi:MAG: hypothetical protein V5A14_01360 [Desulfohalobiaceae bacterium]
MANEESHPTNWSDLAMSLYDKLTGRNAEIIYEFDNFEVFVPLSLDEDTAHARWKVNGTLKLRTHTASGK